MSERAPSPPFARGFKTWCENVALQQRRDLDFEPTDPLNPERLAAHLGVEVRGTNEVPGLEPEVLQTLLVHDSDSWSAVTLTSSTRDLIILNSSHARGRRASDLMHELAHLLIGHTPARVVVSQDGTLLLNSYDKRQEDEAAWLSGCLLLPREALLLIRRRKMTAQAAAREYGVSQQMLHYRIGVTGVDYQLARTRRADAR